MTMHRVRTEIMCNNKPEEGNLLMKLKYDMELTVLRFLVDLNCN